MDSYRDGVVREEARALVAEPGQGAPRGSLGYDASTLEWIARRLQRALEDAQ